MCPKGRASVMGRGRVGVGVGLRVGVGVAAAPCDGNDELGIRG